MLPENNVAKMYTLNPDEGFEVLISTIFDVIEEYGYGTYYIFDCFPINVWYYFVSMNVTLSSPWQLNRIQYILEKRKR